MSTKIDHLFTVRLINFSPKMSPFFNFPGVSDRSFFCMKLLFKFWSHCFKILVDIKKLLYFRGALRSNFLILTLNIKKNNLVPMLCPVFCCLTLNSFYGKHFDFTGKNLAAAT